MRAIIDGNYVWINVNFSKENRNVPLSSRWPKIAGYPHRFVLDAQGALIHSQDTGALESGDGYDKRKLVNMRRRWAPSRGGIGI